MFEGDLLVLVLLWHTGSLVPPSALGHVEEKCACVGSVNGVAQGQHDLRPVELAVDDGRTVLGEVNRHIQGWLVDPGVLKSKEDGMLWFSGFLRKVCLLQ